LKLDVEFLFSTLTSCFRSSVDLTTILYVQRNLQNKDAGSESRVP
jgi:hypothetical protein